MTMRGRALNAVLAMVWGVAVFALWMGLIAGSVSGPVGTAHADPGDGKSTTQSANGSDKPTKQRDKLTRSGPRKESPRTKSQSGKPNSADPAETATAANESVDDAPVRQRPRQSLAKSLPAPAEVRALVNDVTTQVRTALTGIADRTPNIHTSQPFSKAKVTTGRYPPAVPRLTGTASVEQPVPDIAQAIGTFTHPDAPKATLREVNTFVDRIGARARTVLGDVTDRASTTPPALQPIAEMTTPVTTLVTAPRSVPLVNIVGSLVFNVVGAALQVFSGPPMLPPGSNVTVRSSTLHMPDTNQTVRADWYFPKDPDSATGVIYLQHGFMATGPMYSYTAAYLAESTNSIVVAPTLSSNLFDPSGEWIGGEPMQQSVADLFAGNRPELTASASAAAGHPVTLPSKFVLVGHSLGGMLVTGAAGRMVDNGAVDDLAGVVLLDAVDTHHDMPDALNQLKGANYRPVLLISSERYVWNLDGTVGDELQAARPETFNGVMLAGGRHIDAMQGANPILQFAEYVVADFSQPQNTDAVKTISAGWINDMYNGTDSGVHGAPQQSIDIPTPSGTATAVVLPYTSSESVQAMPWDGVAKVILNVLFQYAVYEPLAGQSVPLSA